MGAHSPTFILDWASLYGILFAHIERGTMSIPDWQKHCVYKVSPGFVSENGVLAVDTETTGFNIDHLSLVGVSVCSAEGRATYTPTGHTNYGANVKPEEIVRKLTQEYNAGTKFIFYNAGFDLAVLQKYGFPEIAPEKWGTQVFDVQIMLYHMHLDRYQGKDNQEYIGSLKMASKNMLGLKMITFHECLGMTKKEFNKSKKTFADVPVDENLLAYACADADVTLRLYNKFAPNYVYTDLTRLDYKLIPVVRGMERVGQLIDIGKLQSIERETRARMLAAKQRVLDEYTAKSPIAGSVLNVNSYKQLAAFLFGTLGLPVIIKTDKGAPAVSAEALQRLSWHPAGRNAKVLHDLLEYKYQETYLTKTIMKLLGGIDPDTGKVFSSYNIASIATGRLSTTGDGHFLKKFNFQGIPKDTESDDLSVRNAFVAPEGYVWASFDLSNIELRLIACFSKDPALVKAFNENMDLHQMTCERVFGVGPSHEKYKYYRQVAKIINYNSAYAFSGKWALREKLIEETRREWSKGEADNVFKKLFAAYPGWAKYKTECCRMARVEGYAQSFLGRKRDLTSLYAKSRYDGCAGDRAACNHPIQASCADLLRVAMVRSAEYIASLPRDEVFMVSSIHDELNFNIKKSERTNEILKKIKDIMEWTPKGWPVRVVSGCAVGQSWGLAEEVNL